PDRVRAAVDAGDQRVGQPALLLEDLATRLASDHGLEVAHDQRVRMRAGGGPDQVVRVSDGGDPVAQRLVERILEAAAAGLDRGYFRAQQFHAKDVERLALDVDATHEDLALAPE